MLNVSWVTAILWWTFQSTWSLEFGQRNDRCFETDNVVFLLQNMWGFVASFSSPKCKLGEKKMSFLTNVVVLFQIALTLWRSTIVCSSAAKRSTVTGATRESKYLMKGTLDRPMSDVNVYYVSCWLSYPSDTISLLVYRIQQPVDEVVIRHPPLW